MDLAYVLGIDGTVSEPSITGTNYRSTGLYWSPGPALGVAVGGGLAAQFTDHGVGVTGSVEATNFVGAPRGLFGPDQINQAGNLYVGSSNSGGEGNISYFDLASNNQVAATLELRKARGNQGARENVEPEDQLGAVEFHGYSNEDKLLASVRGVVDGPFLPGAPPPTRIEFLTTSTNTPQRVALTLRQDGVKSSLTPLQFTLDDGEIAKLGENLQGLLTCTDREDNSTALWRLDGGGHTPVLVSGSKTYWTATSYTPAKVNVFVETDIYYLQNNRGVGTRTFGCFMFGG